MKGPYNSSEFVGEGSEPESAVDVGCTHCVAEPRKYCVCDCLPCLLLAVSKFEKTYELLKCTDSPPLSVLVLGLTIGIRAKLTLKGLTSC